MNEVDVKGANRSAMQDAANSTNDDEVHSVMNWQPGDFIKSRLWVTFPGKMSGREFMIRREVRRRQ